MNDDYKRMYMYICMALTFIFEHIIMCIISRKDIKNVKRVVVTQLLMTKKFYMKINKKKKDTRKKYNDSFL